MNNWINEVHLIFFIHSYVWTNSWIYFEWIVYGPIYNRCILFTYYMPWTHFVFILWSFVWGNFDINTFGGIRQYLLLAFLIQKALSGGDECVTSCFTQQKISSLNSINFHLIVVNSWISKCQWWGKMTSRNISNFLNERKEMKSHTK